MTFRKAAFVLVQCTWGILQSLAGFFVFLTQTGGSRFVYHGALVTNWKYGSSVSLGLFVFVSERGGKKQREILTAHEYGHCVQSLILGPFYLLAVGLPSVVWAGVPVFRRLRRKRGVSYYSFYTERWADMLAESVTKTIMDRKE